MHNRLARRLNHTAQLNICLWQHAAKNGSEIRKTQTFFSNIRESGTHGKSVFNCSESFLTAKAQHKTKHGIVAVKLIIAFRFHFTGFE